MKINTSFLEYYKMILEKVSFDRTLFIKEYRKALRMLKGSEIDKLNAWLRTREFAGEPVLGGEEDEGLRMSA